MRRLAIMATEYDAGHSPLPAVPPRTVSAAGDEPHEPDGEHDDRYPPECVHGETDTTEDEGE
jgi:hypothetical protein